MADEQEQQQPQAVREGSRWLYAGPSPDEVIDWFKTQRLHPNMEHSPYIGGIVLIGATEKVKVTRRKANGDLMTIEQERAVFVPYVKVDTRIAYFWDYVSKLNGDDPDGPYVGVIAPVEVPRVKDRASGYYNENFPPGFSVHAVRQDQNRVSKYVCATWRAAIYKREDLTADPAVISQPAGWSAPPGRRGEQTVVQRKAVPILEGTGTKQVPMMRQYPDDSAMMKAETGAIGRALGVAGILVVGTGVASAEDVQEALSAGQGTTAAPETPVLPTTPAGAATEAATAGEAIEQDVDQGDEDVKLRAQAIRLREELERHHPDRWKLYVEWYTERGFPPLAELKGPALKGAVTKLERDLAEVQT